MTTGSTSLVVVGNGIVAHLAALYWVRRFPSLSITIIGPSQRKVPIVGESTIEPSAIFLTRELGLGDYLREHHLPKHCLTFYYKLRNDDPVDRAYSVHESPNFPKALSWQINRFVLDADLRRWCEEAGVRMVYGMVSELHEGRPHQLTVKLETGRTAPLSADWLIDASGRGRFLGKHFGVTLRRPDRQRSAFWFRLADFDRTKLKNIDALGPKHNAYDSYYVTHHFMGRGNWIWCIPLRPREGNDLISIGIAWRPDVYPHDVRSMEDFMEHVRDEHPVITELVESGRVVDTSTYRNYLYSASQVYSADRWCLLGDAGHAVDPLYSTGLAMATIQIQQVTELLRADIRGELAPDFVEDLDAIARHLIQDLQEEITAAYESMHDPYHGHMRFFWFQFTAFFSIFPLWLNGFFTERSKVKAIRRTFESHGGLMDVPDQLFAAASAAIGPPAADDFMYLYEKSLNPQWLCREDEVPAMMARGLAYHAWMRWKLARIAGWQAVRQQFAPLFKTLLGVGFLETRALAARAFR